MGWEKQILGQFEAIAALGNKVQDSIRIEDFHWLDKNGQEINFDVNKQSGLF